MVERRGVLNGILINNIRGGLIHQWVYRYQDYLDQQGNTESKAFVMTGGAQKWVSSYKEQEGLVDFD